MHPEGPEAVARAFLAAMANGRWDGAAALVDPVAMEAAVDGWRRIELSPPPEVTAETLIRNDPDMPPDVAEWEAARFRRALDDSGSPLSHRFARVESVDDLRAMTSVEAMAHHIEALAPDPLGQS